MPVNALGKQSFATALAPPCKSSPAAFGSHPRAKTVLAFTRSFRWLISAFHKQQSEKSKSRLESDYSRKARGVVNVPSF